jgi:hypothetical protein
MDVELMEVTVRFCGGAEGAGKRGEIKCAILHCKKNQRG